MSDSEDWTVTVCSECLCASCWHGEFYCSDYRTSRPVERKASELAALRLEHPSHYSKANLAKIYGIAESEVE